MKLKPSLRKGVAATIVVIAAGAGTLLAAQPAMALPKSDECYGLIVQYNDYSASADNDTYQYHQMLIAGSAEGADIYWRALQSDVYHRDNFAKLIDDEGCYPHP